MNVFESEKFALIFFAGHTSRAHTAPRKDIAQRAKAGCCPCCALATHVASPPTFALGDFNWLKSRRLALWETHGRRAPRRLAARYCDRAYSQLSKSWDWAAHSWIMSAPEPLTRTSPSADPPNAYDIAPIPAPKPAPPGPEVGVLRVGTSPSVARPISPSPVTPPAPTPSKPVTVNFSECVTSPPQDVSVLRHVTFLSALLP